MPNFRKLMGIQVWISLGHWSSCLYQYFLLSRIVQCMYLDKIYYVVTCLYLVTHTIDQVEIYTCSLGATIFYVIFPMHI